MAFLRFLTKVVPEGERRSMVNRYLSKAKVYFKDANFFRYLMVNDYLPRDGNLVSYLLSLAPHITFKASYYRPILRRQMLRSLSFVCGQNGGCSANDLALLIDMVKTPNTPLHNARGLVRMAIFCGADPHVPVVRLTVDPPPPLPPQTPPNTPIILPPMHRWPGFDEDIKSARYWTRWMSENSVGGLPPELTREIFLWHLESLL